MNIDRDGRQIVLRIQDEVQCSGQGPDGGRPLIRFPRMAGPMIKAPALSNKGI